MNDRPRRFAPMLWSLTAAYWMLIFTLTHLPPTKLPKTKVPDVAEHFAAYAILSALLLWSLRFTNLSARAAAWWVVSVCFSYGAIDEISQIPVGRSCSLRDWFADASGTISVVALAVAWGAMRAVRRA